MKQPELGIIINEVRNEKGITQKELADACNIDIRTVQRIISGEVNPRISTLKLMSEFLQHDFISKMESKDADSKLSSLLLTAFISGVIHLIAYLINNALFPQLLSKSNEGFLFGISIIYLLSGSIFYYGIYSCAKSYKNKTLQVAVFVSISLMILFGILGFLNVRNLSFINHLKLLITVVLGLNCIVFGIGLLKSKSQNTLLYRLAGILQIITSPFFILPVPILNFIGIWLSLPFLILLLGIVFSEYRNITSWHNK